MQPINIPKKILVLYADAGFGHRSAAHAVAVALQEKFGEGCRVEMVNPMEDRRTPQLLRDSQADYDKMVRSMPDLYKLSYQASDSAVPTTLVESALIVMLYEVMRDLIRRYEPDAIVSTYPLYQAPLDAVFTIRRRYVPLLAVVTDLVTVHRLWFNTRVSRCLVPTEMVRDLAIEAGLKPEKVLITGIPVHPDLVRTGRSMMELRQDLGWRPDLTTVLAVGSRRVERLGEILRAFNHSGLPIQVVAVAGGDDDQYQMLQAVDWHVPAYLYNFVTNMPEMMRAADMIVCKAGGLIVTESLACGLPLLLIEAIPGQETGNASYVIERGAAEMGEGCLEAMEILFHWMKDNRALLNYRAENARRLGRPQAAFQVADLAWSAALAGPIDRTGRHILGRPRLLDLLRTHRVPVIEPVAASPVETAVETARKKSQDAASTIQDLDPVET
jgi:1,2-diacylglycerol 3-beta-galactosyltransferase